MSDATAIAALQVQIRTLEALVQSKNETIDSLTKALEENRTTAPVQAMRPAAGRKPKAGAT